MERLKHIEEILMGCVEGQLGHLETTDTHELGEAIDMIKDLSQAKYYCSIVKAMEEAEEEEKKSYSNFRDIDRVYGRMYYEGPNGDFQGQSPWRIDRSTRKKDWDYPYGREIQIRDPKEGRSPITRKMYMESKLLHKDNIEKSKELEKYMTELSEDIVEMIEDASPEERQLLEKKMTILVNKIAQLNAH